MQLSNRHTPSRAAVYVGGLVVAALVAAPQPAWAATTYYVEQQNPGCSDTGPGSQASPYCTIGKAATRARAGDSVLVSRGTYVELVRPKRSGNASAPITFQGSLGAVVQGSTRAFNLSSRSWIVVRGFEVRATSDHGIYASSGSSLTIEDNYVHHVGQPIQGAIASGIYLTGTSSSTIRNNFVDAATDSGIAVKGGSSNVTVVANRVTASARGYTRAAAGIDVRNSSGTMIEANRTWANEDSGINVWDSSGSVARNNVVWNNGDHGIDNKTSTGTAITANTVFGSVDSGIEVVGTATGVTLANNISVDNGINSPRTSGNIRVNSTAAAALTLDYDLLWLSSPGVMVDWAGTTYQTLAAFQSATGHEPNGLSANPSFQGSGAGNFRLSADSPAIDSANANAPAHPQFDSEGLARRDDPATTNTGAGTRTYDDRGAHEFQPGGGEPPPPDQPPTANPDTATVNQGAPATTLNVLANDANADGGPMSIGSVTQPANGSTAVTGGGTAVTYQPNAGYCNDGINTDDFGYSLQPGGSTATVAVTVVCSPGPPAGGETLTFPASADAEIRATVADGNFGSDPDLLLDASPQREWLMKFTVGGIGSRTVTSAKLVLWCTDDSKGGGSFSAVTDQSWLEDQVTWANAPPAAAGPFATLGQVDIGASYEIDMRSLITGDGTFSIRAASPLNNDAGYASRDHSSATMRPLLIVVVE